jgi:hypothetical protein
MRSLGPGGEVPAAPLGVLAPTTRPRDPGRIAPQPPSTGSVRGRETKPAPARSDGESPASTAIGTAPLGTPSSRTGQPDAIAATGLPARAARRLRLLVPAYIYPTGPGRKEWLRLIDAAAKVDIVAIVNPASGPGFERNLDYTGIFTEADRQGIKLVGYISTQYAGRPPAEVLNDIDAWVRFYPQIRGFFFDQQPSEAQHTPYYAELRDYAKRRLNNPLLITNPGVPCDHTYLAEAISDVTCVFANFQGFDQFQLPAPLRAFDSSHFAALPYNIPDAETMRAMVDDAIIKRIGYIYISDVQPPNQWGRLPSYWEAEVEAVSQNQ